MVIDRKNSLFTVASLSKGAGILVVIISARVVPLETASFAVD